MRGSCNFLEDVEDMEYTEYTEYEEYTEYMEVGLDPAFFYFLMNGLNGPKDRAERPVIAPPQLLNSSSPNSYLPTPYLCSCFYPE